MSLKLKLLNIKYCHWVLVVHTAQHTMSTQQWRSNFYFIVNLPFVSGPLCCQTIQTSYLWWENVLRLVLLYCPSLQWNRCNIQYHFQTHLNISLNIIRTICDEGMIGELKLLFCIWAVVQSCTIDKIELTILPLCVSFTLQTFTSPLSTATTTNQSRSNL